jgi:hypothetical protein
MLKRIHPGIIALFVQITAVVLIATVIVSQTAIALSLFEWSLLQGLTAGLLSFALRMPVWWIPIHIGFIPLVVVALALHISSTACLNSMPGDFSRSIADLWQNL